MQATLRHQHSIPTNGNFNKTYSFKNSAQDLFAMQDPSNNNAKAEPKEDSVSSKMYAHIYKRFTKYGSEQPTESFKTTSSGVFQQAGSRSRMPYGLSKGLQDIRHANDHYLKVHNQARCKLPKARVVKVKEFYPDPSKEYLPSCTILHKCGEDTGCCESDTMQCVAKTQKTIELYFYKLHLSSVGGGAIGINGADTVEKLAFLNDTECECQAVDDRPRFHAHKTICLQCPTGFNLWEPQIGVCACDCFDKQKSCLKMKRGREPLSEVDRRCVDARRCHQPDCEYGLYDSTLGRCPKKHERKNNKNNSGWWRFDERD